MGGTFEPPESKKIGMHGTAVTKTVLQVIKIGEKSNFGSPYLKREFLIFFSGPVLDSGGSKDVSLKFSENSKNYFSR